MNDPIDYPRRAPGRGGSDVPIKVASMELRTAIFWDRFIQPGIREALPARADKFWSWGALRLLFPLSQRIKGYHCPALSILVEDDAGRAVPAAMLLFIENYPHVAPGAGGAPSIFTWFIATAPTQALRELGVADPPSLGRTCVDVALVTSVGADLAGRMWLHCAVAGGEPLMRFYGEKCRLLRLHEDEPLPVDRINDGRFFYTSEALAEELIIDMDAYRAR